MKYMLLIHQGTTPLPGSKEWEELSKQEQGAVYGAYRAINENKAVSPGLRMGSPDTANHGARPRRQDLDHRWPLR
jgi:hypothetical protein